MSNDFSNDIAIIGMACRYPQSPNLEAFWHNIRDGVECLTAFTDEELLAAGVEPHLLADPNYVKAYGYLDGIDQFDARFFGFTPREAQSMDPQQRLLLESAWTALEHAGYDPQAIDAVVGVYAGTGQAVYYLQNVLTNREILETLGHFQTYIGNDKDFVTTRISYKLNLKGPSFNVQTACSTSLVATHLAVQSLLNGECDVALAGGCSIVSLNKEGYLYLEGGIYSADGHCRPFDAKGQGIVGGDGVGMIVLKRLDDALDDGDTIHAVIKGTAINNDGDDKIGYTAPSVSGQANAIAEAQAIADIDPATITYIEAHGTATPLGDPIEVAALTRAFRQHTDAVNYCGLGSVKGNIGHTNAAAGVAGVIKTVLALKHKQLPPSLHFETPNPEIDFANSPFYVNTALREWRRVGQPRRAGVSSFGLGGTNAHVVLEEAPLRPKTISVNRDYHILPLSAKTPAQLDEAIVNLERYLQSPSADLGDIAYTLQFGRQQFAHRYAVACRAGEYVATTIASNKGSRAQAQDAPTVVFMYPGQGSQHVNMCRDLYESEPIFREWVDRSAVFCEPHLGMDIRTLLYPDAESAETQFPQATIAPIMFAVSYGLTQLWHSRGVQPAAVIGHSVSELIAGCVAGILSWQDTLRLIMARDRLIKRLPAGLMLSAFVGEQEIAPYLVPNIEIAVINSSQNCVLTGTEDAINAVADNLAEADISYRIIPTSHAGHSSLVDPIIAPYQREIERVALSPPALPMVSSVTGVWLSAEEATSPHYWARQMREPVRFADSLDFLAQQHAPVLLEVAGGQSLSIMARRHLAEEKVVVAASARSKKQQLSDQQHFLQTLGQLWCAGVAIDWNIFHRGTARQRVPLPTYPFARDRHWLTPPAHTPSHLPAPLAKNPNVGEWFYIPSWQRAPNLPAPTSDQIASFGACLVFVDEHGLSEQVAQSLSAHGVRTFTVKAGEQFSSVNEQAFVLDPRQPEHYHRLLAAIDEQGDNIQTIFHLWLVGAENESAWAGAGLETAQDRGFYSLLYLAQALDSYSRAAEPIRLCAVTTGVYDVTGAESLRPEKATVIGPVKVISAEYQTVSALHIDVEAANQWGQTAQNLLAEMLATHDDHTKTIVAYRGRYRWQQAFVPTSVPETTELPVALKAEGVYLITGGLGGIGLQLAEYLVEKAQAKLVLTGRSALPPRSEWKTRQLDDDRVGRRIKAVLALEAQGAEVLILAADVADFEQMKRVKGEVEAHFGAVNGIIHSAGIAGEKMMALTDRVSAKTVLNPKVNGSIILNQLFGGDNLDFIVFCSSLGSVLGGVGQVGYCSANAFQDAFATYLNENTTRTCSISWEIWQDVGMGVEVAVPEAMRQQREDVLRKGMTLAEGKQVFHRALQATEPHLLISTQDFVQRYQQNVNVATLDTPQFDEPIVVAEVESARQTLSSEYVAPTNRMQATLVSIWQQLFGISVIGIHDDFFELGGHSLMATQLLNRIRKEYPQSKLSFHELFTNPTVAGISTLLTTEVDIPSADILSQYLAQPASQRVKFLQQYVAAQLSSYIGQPTTSLLQNPNAPIAQIDVGVRGLIWDVKRDFELPLYPHELLQRPSLAQIAHLVAGELAVVHQLEGMSSAETNTLTPHPMAYVPDRQTAQRSLPPLDKTPNPPLLFLLSVPRSGSTLLRMMLAGHSALFSPPELSLLSFDTLAEWLPTQRVYFHYNGVEHALMNLLGIDGENARQWVDEAVATGETIQSVYRYLQEKAAPRLLIDKTPGYAISTTTLDIAERMFERPCYIHLVRHPYPVIKSFVQNRMHAMLSDTAVDPYRFAEAIWRDWNNNIIEHQKRIGADRVFTLTFEALVATPEQSMRSLCEFLSIAYEPAMITPYAGQRMGGGPGDPNIMQHTAIDPALGESWKQIELPYALEPATQTLAHELGYQLPQESDSAEIDPETLLNQLDTLSDAEVERLLQQMLNE